VIDLPGEAPSSANILSFPVMAAAATARVRFLNTIPGRARRAHAPINASPRNSVPPPTFLNSAEHSRAANLRARTDTTGRPLPLHSPPNPQRSHPFNLSNTLAGINNRARRSASNVNLGHRTDSGTSSSGSFGGAERVNLRSSGSIQTLGRTGFRRRRP